jgi:hypothetical protein
MWGRTHSSVRRRRSRAAPETNADECGPHPFSHKCIPKNPTAVPTGRLLQWKWNWCSLQSPPFHLMNKVCGLYQARRSREKETQVEGTARVGTDAFVRPAKAKPSGPDHRSVVLSGTPLPYPAGCTSSILTRHSAAGTFWLPSRNSKRRHVRQSISDSGLEPKKHASISCRDHTAGDFRKRPSATIPTVFASWPAY